MENRDGKNGGGTLNIFTVAIALATMLALLCVAFFGMSGESDGDAEVRSENDLDIQCENKNKFVDKSPKRLYDIYSLLLATASCGA